MTIALFDQVAPAFIIIEHSVLGHIRKLFDWQDQVGAKIAQIMLQPLLIRTIGDTHQLFAVTWHEPFSEHR